MKTIAQMIVRIGTLIIVLQRSAKPLTVTLDGCMHSIFCDQNTFTMNLTEQKMKTAERSLIIITLLGFGMKMLHLPTAAIILTIGSVLLALFYFHTATKARTTSVFVSDQHSKMHAPLSIMAGVAMGLSVIAVLLKVQHWPGATFLATLGVLGCLITLLAVIMIRGKQPLSSGNYSALTARILPTLVLVSTVAGMAFITH